MEQELPAESLLGWLKQVPDPRRREGRIYPLNSTLGLLILGALNGQRSLRGMWQWGCQHWAVISRPLGFTGQRRPPSYGAVWYLLGQVDAAAFAAVLQAWMSRWSDEPGQGVSVDGKVLRGSRRIDPTQAALSVVTAAAHQVKVVLGQHAVEGGDQVEAAVQLLRSLPLKGKVVTTDAGLMHRPVVKTIVQGGGDYLGPLKDNEPGVKEVVREWVEAHLSPPGPPAPGRLPPHQ
jgi:hypothetical protein